MQGSEASWRTFTTLLQGLRASGFRACRRFNALGLRLRGACDVWVELVSVPSIQDHEAGIRESCDIRCRHDRVSRCDQEH